MSSQSPCIKTLMGTALVVCAFAQGPATAQEKDTLLLNTGTTLRFEGVEAQQAGCQQYVPCEQYTKVAGRVILPETRANVCSFLEYWGRDSGNAVVRTSPNGDVFNYYLGAEYKFLIAGPVGTYWEFTDPETGNTLRYQIVRDGITLTWPTGEVYDNLVRMNTYCTSCGPEWVLWESFWLSHDLGLYVLYMTWDAENQCVPRWLWLVNVTRR